MANYFKQTNRYITSNEIIHINLHPQSYQYLLNNPEYICWDTIQYNPNNFMIYKYYPNKISWNALKHNHLLILLLEKDNTKINWQFRRKNKPKYYSLNIYD